LHDLLAASEAYFADAMDLGVDSALDALDLDEIPDDVKDRLAKKLADRIKENAKYVRDSLLPDLVSGKYEATRDKLDDEDLGDDPTDEEINDHLATLQGDLDDELDDRVGMYADQLYPTAHVALSAVSGDVGVLMTWELDPGADHCENCPEFADGGPYCDPDDPVEDVDPLPAFPGDGTDCFSNCRCTLAFDQESYDAYAHEKGLDEAA
jgi:hypothetical protein